MSKRRRSGLPVCLGGLLLATSLAAVLITGDWTASGLGLGVLFGFILHKGDLCFAAACSEVVIMRDGAKLIGFWVAIVVAMLGFVLLEALRIVTLDPLGACWAANLSGGLLFGVGMTLAGGCVAGSLYKAATGNVNSMAALVAIPLGALAVQRGPARSVRQMLQQYEWTRSNGETLTLSSLSGVPAWGIAIVAALATLAVWLRRRRRPTGPKGAVALPPTRPSLERLLRRGCRPWQAGLALGLLAWIAYPASEAAGRHYPLGVTTGVMQAGQLLTDAAAWSRPLADSGVTSIKKAPIDDEEPIVWWEVLLVAGLFAGAWASGRLAGEALLARPPEQTIVAFFGGLLTGAGAVLGMGCSIGHIVSGWALLSVGSILFGLAVGLGAWATTCAYLVGGIPAFRRPK